MIWNLERVVYKLRCVFSWFDFLRLPVLWTGFFKNYWHHFLCSSRSICQTEFSLFESWHFFRDSVFLHWHLARPFFPFRCTCRSEFLSELVWQATVHFRPAENKRSDIFFYFADFFPFFSLLSTSINNSRRDRRWQPVWKRKFFFFDEIDGEIRSLMILFFWLWGGGNSGPERFSKCQHNQRWRPEDDGAASLFLPRFGPKWKLFLFVCWFYCFLHGTTRSISISFLI